jgi:uncharacterized membrane protein YeaQ/YmgE (transglycosylase-associated protein family)
MAPSRRGQSMEKDATVGWTAAIIIGGIAGWLAERFMKSDMGILMNMILGIVGAFVANAVLGVFGISLGGWTGYLIAGVIGACILIAAGRMFRLAARARVAIHPSAATNRSEPSPDANEKASAAACH